MSKLDVYQKITVNLKMDELDVTAAETKATYEEIREYVKEHTGLNVSDLYIAQGVHSYVQNVPPITPFCSNSVPKSFTI